MHYGLFRQPGHSAHEMASTVGFSSAFQEPPGSTERLYQSNTLSEVPQSKRITFLLKAVTNVVMFGCSAVNSLIDNDSVAVMCLGVLLLTPGEL